MQSQIVALITATDGKKGNKGAVTCRAGPAGQWASAPQRWPCRGWSHTLRQCSPPSGSPGLAACGGACPARSGAGSSGPERPHIQHEIQQCRWWENSLKCPEREFNEERSPRQSWLGWRCPVSSDSGSCTSWWRWKPVGGNIRLSQPFLVSFAAKVREKRQKNKKINLARSLWTNKYVLQAQAGAERYKTSFRDQPLTNHLKSWPLFKSRTATACPLSISRSYYLPPKD